MVDDDQRRSAHTFSPVSSKWRSASAMPAAPGWGEWYTVGTPPIARTSGSSELPTATALKPDASIARSFIVSPAASTQAGVEAQRLHQPREGGALVDPLGEHVEEAARRDDAVEARGLDNLATLGGQ